MDHEELLALAACATEGFTSNYRMQLVLEKHPSDITLLLKNLCQEGYLISTGIGKGTTYHLNEGFNQSSFQNGLNNSPYIVQENSSASVTFSHPTLSTNGDDVSNVVSSGANVVSSDSNEVSSDRLPKAKRGKVNLQQLQNQIIEFCEEDYKSIEEIAKGVGKKIKYLNNGIITKMVNDGLLDRKYPKIPTHPDQKYKSHPRKSDATEPTLF